jgi:DNA-binding NarL/FixJ family response regulator
MKPIKVFIVDDHYMVIEGIRSLLIHEKNIEWCGHAMHANSCLSYLSDHTPDVILMDINLPDTNGIELTKKIKKLYPNIKILGLSTFNQISFVKELMNNGGSGYLLKNADKEEIMKALRSVVEGENYLSPEVEKMLEYNQKRIPTITRREREVLQLIAQGMTNTEIANKIYVSSNTIDTHRKNLLLKFNAKNAADLIRMAFTFNLLTPNTD